jgi:thiamine-monophosphate kinase
VSVESEFKLIDRFTRCFPKVPAPWGPGDDCAVLPPSRFASCVTTDAVLEGVHFTQEHFTLEDIGYKALAVNLSDLAAMGATPSWFLCSLELPRETTEAQVVSLGKGMAKLARRTGINLVGGNVTSAKTLGLSLTVAGEIRRGSPLLRSGARRGDFLFVSGHLGGAARGLELLQTQKRSTGPAARAIQRQKRPTPRLALGKLLQPWATACMDLSDGLVQDLSHLCTASKVGATVRMDSLPLDPALSGLSRDHQLRLALAGGEDYELLFSVPPRLASRVERACKAAGETITRVGVISRGGLHWEGSGTDPASATGGFDHFRRTGAGGRARRP